jgi:hypothetical protein
MKKLPNLPLRLDLIPGESIFGFLGRLAQHNLLPSTKALVERLGMATKGSMTKLIEARENITEISQSIGLPADTLSKMLPNMREDEPGTFAIHDLELRDHNYARNGRRVSPKSLSVSPHIRFSWHLADIGYCRESWEVLIDTCPVEHCQSKLSLTPKMAVHRCDKCGYDLREAKAKTILPEDRPALQFVADLASTDEIEVQRGLMQVHPFLRQLNRGTLLQLVNLFGRADAALKGDTNTKQRKYGLGYPHLTAAGGRILRSYPTSILDIIERDQDSEAPDFFKRLQTLAITGQTKATLALLKDMIAELRPIARSSVRGLAIVRNNHGRLSITEASALLNIDKAAARRLVNIGAIAPEHIRGKSRMIDWFVPGQVEALASQMRDRISTDTIHAEYGLPFTAIEQLVALKQLKWHPLEAIKVCFQGEFLVRTEFETFLSKLQANITLPNKDSNERISLAECFALVGPAPKPWGPLLVQAFEGTLLGGLQRISAKRGFKVSNLTVAPEMAVQVMTRALTWVPPPEPIREHCSQFEAEERLACNPADIAALLKAGALRRVHKASTKLDRKSVIEVSSSYISTREIAARLGIEVQQIGPWARKWLLAKPVGITMWCRADIEPFLPSLLSSSETKKFQAEGRLSSLTARI